MDFEEDQRFPDFSSFPAPSSEAFQEPARERAPRPEPSREPVLICVDDEPEVLGALRRCFRHEPYIILEAGNAEQAIQLLGRVPHVDLVLADERMPGTSGTELLREVRKRSPGTLRAVLTGHPSDTLIPNGLEAGADVFFYKPWDDEKLRESVRCLLVPGRRPDGGPESSGTFDLGGEGG